MGHYSSPDELPTDNEALLLLLPLLLSGYSISRGISSMDQKITPKETGGGERYDTTSESRRTCSRRHDEEYTTRHREVV